MPMPLGTARDRARAGARDAPPAARLREAGAVILGKTTMPDYGMLSSGLSSFHAPDAQPLGPDARTRAAAAPARPPPPPPATGRCTSAPTSAARCACRPAGAASSRSSRASGRDPDRPAVRRPRRRADDAHRRRRGADDGRAGAARRPRRDEPAGAGDRLAARSSATSRGLRIGLLLDAGWGLPVDAEIAAAVEAAARRVRGGRRAASSRVAPFMTRAMLDGMDDFWRMRAWLDISALPSERRARVLPFIVDWARARRERSRASASSAATARWAAMRDAAVAACRPFDVVLSPTAPIAGLRRRAGRRRPTIPSGRSSTSPSRCRST